MNQYPPFEDTNGARIIVVDDERNIRNALGHALRLSLYVVDEAADGDQALAKLEASHYDVMVLDLRMPGLYGVDVMRRAHRMRPELLIIILTGHATLDSAMAAIKSEAVDYLLKPVSVHQVIDTVARALRERSYRERQKVLVDVISQATSAMRQAEPQALPSRPGDTGWGYVLHRPPLLLDVKQQRIRVENRPDDHSAQLTKNETAVLATLMQNVDSVFTCQQLMSQALGFAGDASTAESTIRPIVFRLRQKIEANPKRPTMLRTVRGGGYFLSPVGGR